MTKDSNTRITSVEPPGKERRRSERVLIRIPVILFGITLDNRHLSEEAETSIINRNGALLRSRTAFKPGSTLELTNSFSKAAEKFRVVWVGQEQKQGAYDLAVEMLTPHPDFWGVSFPTRPTVKT